MVALNGWCKNVKYFLIMQDLRRIFSKLFFQILRISPVINGYLPFLHIIYFDTGSQSDELVAAG